MKKILFLMLAMLLALAGTSMAATVSDTVPVTATILGYCTIDTSTASIDFGSLDPNAAPNVTASVSQPTVNCTAGMPYTITDDDGVNELVANQPRMYDGVANYIQYSLTYTGAPLAGTGLDVPMNIIGDLPGANYSLKPIGNYSDTVTFTVTW
jgi:spore coat protein U-like protein